MGQAKLNWLTLTGELGFHSLVGLLGALRMSILSNDEDLYFNLGCDRSAFIANTMITSGRYWRCGLDVNIQTAW